jgi:hypothetical protein
MMHRCGKYKDTRDIFNDINTLILGKFDLLSAAGEGEDMRHVTAFQNFFDQVS